MEYTIEITLDKADGRRGFVHKLEMALLCGEIRLTPGEWEITLMRIGQKELAERAKAYAALAEGAALGVVSKIPPSTKATTPN